MEAPTYVPLASRAALAKALLVAVVAVQALAAFTSFELSHLGDEIGQTGGPSIAGVDAIENRHALARTLQLALCAVAALALVRWFRRARANVAAAGERLQPPLVGALSRLSGAAVVLVVRGAVRWPRAETSVEMELAGMLQLVGTLLGLAAAVLAYAVVHRTTARQASRALQRPPEPEPLGAGEAV